MTTEQPWWTISLCKHWLVIYQHFWRRVGDRMRCSQTSLLWFSELQHHRHLPTVHLNRGESEPCSSRGNALAEARELTEKWPVRRDVSEANRSITGAILFSFNAVSGNLWLIKDLSISKEDINPHTVEIHSWDCIWGKYWLYSQIR